jgi:hypothetical protein
MNATALVLLAPDEGMTVSIPLGDRTLNSLFDIVPRLEAAAYERQRAEQLPLSGRPVSLSIFYTPARWSHPAEFGGFGNPPRAAKLKELLVSYLAYCRCLFRLVHR